MALSNKELEYFKGELPEGMKVVDLTGIKNYKDFVENYCPEADKGVLPHSVCMRKALENFIKQIRK